MDLGRDSYGHSAIQKTIEGVLRSHVDAILMAVSLASALARPKVWLGLRNSRYSGPQAGRLI